MRSSFPKPYVIPGTSTTAHSRDAALSARGAGFRRSGCFRHAGLDRDGKWLRSQRCVSGHGGLPEDSARCDPETDGGNLQNRSTTCAINSGTSSVHRDRRDAHGARHHRKARSSAPSLIRLLLRHLRFSLHPGPRPKNFAMPNVQVESGECDALPQAEISQLIDTASSKHSVGANLLRAVMRQESGFRPCAVSTAGAMGLMQIMPDTASDLGLSDPFNPAANVDAGAKYLKQMLTRYNGDETLALSAYNAGPGTGGQGRWSSADLRDHGLRVANPVQLAGALSFPACSCRQALQHR